MRILPGKSISMRLKGRPVQDGKKRTMDRTRRAAKAFLLVVMAVCLFQIARIRLQSRQHIAVQESLRGMITETEEGAAPSSTQQDIPAQNPETQSPEAQNLEAQISEGQPPEYSAVEEPASPVILKKYAALYAENQDFAGWLSIEGMKIDYPVMQRQGDDEYYLNRDFYGKESRFGSLFVREKADLNEGTNFVIYGHHTKDGSMFGDLDFYLKEGFYKEHPSISFDTLYEERIYDILAVFRSEVYGEEEKTFKYYQFYSAETPEEFAEFYSHIKAESLYDTGVTAEFGDTFLTLSTCSYHVEDGRFVVVAKRRC